MNSWFVALLDKWNVVEYLICDRRSLGSATLNA
jgi:hypothetical protein